MSLVRSPAAGHESARRFYSAFYLWSRLSYPQCTCPIYQIPSSHASADATTAHIKSSRPKHIYSKGTSLNYSTTAAPATTTTPPLPQTIQTVTLLLNNTDHARLTKSQNAKLEKIATQTGARFELGDSEKYPQDGLHRLVVTGTPDALLGFSRGVLGFSTYGRAPDGGARWREKRDLSRRPVRKDDVEKPRVDTMKVDAREVDTTKVDVRKVDTPKADTSKADTTKVDAPKVDTSKVDTSKVDEPKADTPKVDATEADIPVVSSGTSVGVATKDISGGASDEIATNDKSAGASKIVTPDTSTEASSKIVSPDISAGAPVISSTDKPPFKHRIRTVGLTALQQRNIHILTESFLDAIKAESGVQHLTVSTQSQHSPPGHAAICVSGSRSARDLAIRLVRKALHRDVAAPQIMDKFRQTMRSVPSPVAVLTASLATVEDEKARFRGMTVSSFTAVSVSPEPIISFNIRTPSRTLEALDSYSKFYLHIPAANILGKTIADAFTKPHADPTQTFRDLSATKGIEVREEHGYLPSIHGHGILVRYLCQIIKDKTVSIGDHVVLFAWVKHVFKANVDSSAKYPPAGLSYVHGTYSRASELVDHDSEQTLKLPDDEHTPMLTPEQIMAQIVDPILNSKSEHQVSEKNESATRKEPTLNPSRNSEVEEQQPQDINERYFTFAEEYEADEDTEDVDTERPDETSSTPSTNPPVSANYTSNAPTSATIPTGTRPFSTFHRPATTTTTLGLSSTRRTISTSTTTTPSTIDPSILSQTVESYIYSPFDPETNLIKPKLYALHIRIAQRKTLDKCTRRLELAYENGEIDEEALLVLGGKVQRLRGDLMRTEMNLGEYEEFVSLLGEALGEDFGVSMTETGDRETRVSEGVNEVENEEGVEKEDTDMEFEASNETGEERRTEISEEESEEGFEKKDLGMEFEEMMDKRQE